MSLAIELSQCACILVCLAVENIEMKLRTKQKQISSELCDRQKYKIAKSETEQVRGNIDALWG